jgi:hypothetical protein
MPRAAALFQAGELQKKGTGLEYKYEVVSCDE